MSDNPTKPKRVTVGSLLTKRGDKKMANLMFTNPLREACLYQCMANGKCNCYARRQEEGKEIIKAIEEGRSFEGFEWCACRFCNDKDHWTMKGPSEARPVHYVPAGPRPQAEDFLDGRCECGCCHSGDLGACDDYILGGNGLCVYCDHGEACHERDKDRKFYNGPLSYGIRKPKCPWPN